MSPIILPPPYPFYRLLYIRTAAGHNRLSHIFPAPGSRPDPDLSPLYPASKKRYPQVIV